MEDDTKPRHTPLTPTMAWAIVDNKTGKIVLTNNESQLFICPERGIPVAHARVVHAADRAQMVLITSISPCGEERTT
jgi:hypothetical protein